MGNEMMGQGEILLYSNGSDKEYVSVVFKDETFWLTQKAMAELFDVNVPAVSKHLQNIYEEQELSRDATISKMETVRQEGERQVKRTVDFYNLDAIIAVGYRVNSKKATRFRQWATKTLKEYIQKGFVLNDEMMKNGRPSGQLRRPVDAELLRFSDAVDVLRHRLLNVHGHSLQYLEHFRHYITGFGGICQGRNPKSKPPAKPEV